MEVLPLVLLGLVSVAIGVSAGVGDSPHRPILIVAGVIAAIFAVTSPIGALTAWVLVLFLRPTDFYPALGEYRPAMRLGMLTAFLLGAGKLIRKDLKLVHTRHNFLIGWLTVAVALSVVNGLDLYASLDEFKSTFVKLVMFWFLALNILTTSKRVQIFQWALAISCVVLGGWALYFAIWGPPVPTDPGSMPIGSVMSDALRAALEESEKAADQGRAFLVKGLLEDPNDLALAQLMATPFLIEAWLGAKGLKKWLLGLMMLVPIGGVLATQSRGGLLGLAAGVFVIIRRRFKSPIITGGAVAVFLVAGALASGITDRTGGGQAESGVDMSAQGRLDAWKSGANMLWNHPATGVGYKLFNDYYLSYAINPVEWLPGKSAHNAWVQCMAETGLLGVSAFLLLFLRSAWINYKLAQLPEARRRTSEGAFIRGQLANLAAVGAAAFFLSVAWHYYLYIVFVLAAAGEVIWLGNRSECTTASGGPSGPSTGDPAGASGEGDDAVDEGQGEHAAAVGAEPTT